MTPRMRHYVNTQTAIDLEAEAKHYAVTHGDKAAEYLRWVAAQMRTQGMRDRYERIADLIEVRKKGA